MPIEPKITASGLSPQVSLSKIRKLKQLTLRIIARSWHTRYSAGKFTAAGARKYNYAKRKTKEVRTGRILRSKTGRPLAPSGLPLVWTGDSRNRARDRKITGNSKRSHVTVRANKLNFRPGGINMRREYTLVLASEERVIGRDGEKFLRRQFTKGKKNIAVQVT